MNPIRVTWTEEDYIPMPMEYTDNPTPEDWNIYKEELRKAKRRRQGVVLQFVTTMFRTKALIKTDDHKLVCIPIKHLTVIEDEDGTV